MDKVDKRTRSRNMAHIRGKNTSPELQIRKKMSAMGLRYRIHTSLPGKPDIVFPKKKVAIFINGCFWHGHGCKTDHKPKSNIKFWQEKIINNKQRDIGNLYKLKDMGWNTLTLWECEIIDSLNLQIEKIKELIN